MAGIEWFSMQAFENSAGGAKTTDVQWKCGEPLGAINGIARFPPRRGSVERIPRSEVSKVAARLISDSSANLAKRTFHAALVEPCFRGHDGNFLKNSGRTS